MHYCLPLFYFLLYDKVAQCELLRLTVYVCLQRQRAQQIVPCTVSQLMSAAQAEDVFRVGEVEVAQVTQITSVNMRMVVRWGSDS